MAEKKIVTLGIRIDESTLLKIKGLAELEGVTESEFARMAISNLVAEKESIYLGLHSIFGQACEVSKPNHVAHRATKLDLPEFSDGVKE